MKRIGDPTHSVVVGSTTLADKVAYIASDGSWLSSDQVDELIDVLIDARDEAKRPKFKVGDLVLVTGPVSGVSSRTYDRDVGEVVDAPSGDPAREGRPKVRMFKDGTSWYMDPHTVAPVTRTTGTPA